jgi:serine protease DegQ
MRGSPADRSGIKPGDVLLSIDSQPIKDAQVMLDLIAGLKPGASARFGLSRAGRQAELDVAIGKRPPPTTR